MEKNYYELTYIIDPVLEEDQYKEMIEKYNDLIQENDGEIDEVDEWGIRKFEYEMNSKSNGFYVNLYFHAPGALIEKLERALRIDDHIMRFLTLKYDAKMLRYREQQKRNAVPSIFEQEEETSEEEES
ncbi:MAG: 30S ribosomal protein S6 [Balneolaceae bacterium]|nr:30S ribosomal protein S6 [Balneolaceae bacterium]